MADLEGGNYSISNPGIFGSMFGTPLINYPQAAVFNMNSIKEDVVAINGRVEIRPVCSYRAPFPLLGYLLTEAA